MPRMPFRRRKPLSERIADKLNEARTGATEQIETAANTIVDQAKAAAHRLPSPSIDRERVSQEAHDVAHLAATTAVDLWDRARSRSQTVRESIPSRDYLSDQLAVAASTIDSRVREAEKAMQARAVSARDRARKIESDTEAKVVAAKERSTEIAGETVKAGRGVLVTVFWLGAAIAAIYFLLFDRERRDKVLSITKEVVAETRDIINDLRGYDQEFA